MKRNYLISEVSLSVIRRELTSIEKNTIRTPDTDANFKQIRGILASVEGNKNGGET